MCILAWLGFLLGKGRGRRRRRRRKWICCGHYINLSFQNRLLGRPPVGLGDGGDGVCWVVWFGR